jgi:hypothetical protein
MERVQVKQRAKENLGIITNATYRLFVDCDDPPPLVVVQSHQSVDDVVMSLTSPHLIPSSRTRQPLTIRVNHIELAAAVSWLVVGGA